MIKQLKYYKSLNDSKVFDVNTATIAGAISDINRMEPGFKNVIASGDWRVYGDGSIIEPELVSNKMNYDLVEIYPVVAGEKSQESTNAYVIGGVLLAASFFTAGTSNAFLAPYLLQGGILAMTYGYTLSLQVDPDEATDGSQDLSSTNTASENSPIPLVFGNIRTRNSVRVSMEVSQTRRGAE